MINTQLKEALIVLGVTLVVISITMPKCKAKSAIPKPETADNDELNIKENARIALDAYMTAVDNRESSRNLQSLNNELAQTYGLRIYRNGNYYVAKDSTGKEILYGK
jgi:hypothetical protein